VVCEDHKMKHEMKYLFATLICSVLPIRAATFQVEAGANALAWAKILGSVGIERASSNSNIVVEGAATKAETAGLAATGHILILQGDSAAGRSLGILPQKERVTVRQIVDTHGPQMQIIWEQAAEIARTQLPGGFTVYATERWKGAPVLAGKRTENGAVLWIATEPGLSGIERYPYLLQALVDLGLDLPLHATNLWAFFDSSYRIRADVDYLAKRWRAAGVSVLHVAAWHNMEPDAAQDEYIARLIQACHRNAILVYAWLELPHVSEKFWAEHPEWREKTGVGQDAQLDWRKLMNLQNKDCSAAVGRDIGELLKRFDWDGVNLAELYFESLEGASNPARFTPMNDDVRTDYKKLSGIDPKALLDPGASAAELRKFLDYRAGLASNLQAKWLDEIEKTRAQKPYLDIVLTHIDDRFEPGIRDALGADVARTLSLIEARKSTLLVEDPATLWNLGAERYSKLAEQYRALTPDRARLAVDINVVERYQDVYPTKKQTGVELLELVHEAAVSFSQVALYFENSLEKQDLRLLPAAANTASAQVDSVGVLTVDSKQPTRVEWTGAAEMDGTLWPVQNARTILAPSGKHRFEASAFQPGVVIADFNGEIRSAAGAADRAAVEYFSKSRAVAVLGNAVTRVEVDGVRFAGETAGFVVLPAGEHRAVFYR
jgi:hypothetical protein